MELSSRYQQYLDRMASAVDRRKGLAGALNWTLRNTMLQDRKFNLKHHEAQQAWFMGGDVMDPHPLTTIIKPSQIGATEATIRMTVAFAAVMKGINVLYVMPTGKMAEKNSTVRIKPIIETCEALNYGRGTTQTTLLRQVGTSFVHIGGTQDATGGAISTPAEAVILDEYDFMNMEVAGKYMSRIRHATEFDIPESDQKMRGILYRFSTPTIPGYGVDGLIQQSNAMRYMVKCGRCGTRQAPNFFDDVVIPGFDDDIRDFRAEHVSNPSYKITEAYLKCQHCGKKLHEELLATDREWVAQRPSIKDHRGFETKPYDFYHYNPVPNLLDQIKNSYTYADWVNFSLGEAYEDGDQSFSTKGIADGSQLKGQYVPPDRAGNLYGPSIGCDVGNTSDIVVSSVDLDINKMPTRVHVHYWERYNTKGNLANKSDAGDYTEGKVPELYDRVRWLKEQYRASGVVIDSLPDQTAALKVANEKWGAQSQYVDTAQTGGTTGFMTLADDDRVAKINRTRLFNHLLYLWNSGNVILPAGMPKWQVDELKTNVRNLKKVVSRVHTDTGEPQEMWIKVDSKKPDHFMHSLLYSVAAGILHGGNAGIIMAPMPKAVAVGGRHAKKPGLSREDLWVVGR